MSNNGDVKSEGKTIEKIDELVAVLRESRGEDLEKRLKVIENLSAIAANTVVGVVLQIYTAA